MAKKKIVINKGGGGISRRPAQVRVNSNSDTEIEEAAEETDAAEPEESAPAEAATPKVRIRKKGVKINPPAAEEEVAPEEPEQTDEEPASGGPKIRIRKKGAASPPPAPEEAAEEAADEETADEADSGPVRVVPATVLAEAPTDSNPGEAAYFRFYCIKCGQKLKVRRSSEGISKPCPSCAHALTVPKPFDES